MTNAHWNGLRDNHEDARAEVVELKGVVARKLEGDDNNRADILLPLAFALDSATRRAKKLALELASESTLDSDPGRAALSLLSVVDKAEEVALEASNRFPRYLAVSLKDTPGRVRFAVDLLNAELKERRK